MGCGDEEEGAGNNDDDDKGTFEGIHVSVWCAMTRLLRPLLGLGGGSTVYTFGESNHLLLLVSEIQQQQQQENTLFTPLAFQGGISTEAMIVLLRILSECMVKLSGVDCSVLVKQYGVLECFLAVLFWSDRLGSAIAAKFKYKHVNNNNCANVTDAVIDNDQEVVGDGASSFSEDDLVKGFFMVKRDAVRGIANVCGMLETTSDFKLVQDEVRRLGGIGLLLNQCIIDDANPCKLEWERKVRVVVSNAAYAELDLKEYAILAIRNLTRNNAENQHLIQTMEAMDISDKTRDEFRKRGMDIGIDPKTKKIKLVENKL